MNKPFLGAAAMWQTRSAWCRTLIGNTRGGVTLALACLLACFATTTRAETLSMPTGPASLQGLGSEFGASPATGTGSFSVPLELPPGFLAPALALQYASGNGRDVLGMSFELPVTSIYRTTNRGAPRFDEEDRFAVEGSLSGELVRVNEAMGYYRLRTEGENALFVRHKGASPACQTTGDSWEIRHPDGTRQCLGSAFESQQKSQGRTFRWYVASERDAFGHEVRYGYFRDQNRVYLASIDYQKDGVNATQFLNRVRFSYESRPDAYVDYSSGDEVVTAQRLREVQVWHRARLLRSYRFSYQEGLLFSLLRQVHMEGEHGLALPPLTLGYYQTRQNSAGARQMLNAPPLDGLLDGAATFEDVNRDGLDDLLVGLSGEWSYYENIDGVRWADTPIKLKGAPHRGLYEDDVLLADMDGDGDRDVVESHGHAFRYFPALEVERGVFVGFGSAVDLASDEGDFFLQAPEVKLSDLNRDGRTDVLMQSPGTDLWLVNQADPVKGNYLSSVLAPELPSDVQLNDERLQLIDFNGDGFEDLVLVDMLGRGSVRVWYGTGAGRFTARHELRNVPSGAQEEFSLQDLNNDGQADLVRTSGSWATYYLNDGRGAFTEAQGHYYGLPGEVDTQKRLFADLNGNGTTDLVWITYEGQLVTLDLVGQPFNGLLRTIDNGKGLVTTLTYRSSTDYLIDAKRKGLRWRTTLPTPIPVVASIDTTDSFDLLGLSAQRRHVEYQYEDGHYDGVRKVFRAFGKVEVFEPGDDFHEGLRTRSLFHVGKNLQTGADEEALAGLSYAQLQYGEDGGLYATSETKWELRELCRNSGAERDYFPSCTGIEHYARDKDHMLVVPLARESLEGSWEQTNEPRFSGVATEYDAWGEETRSNRYGEIVFNTPHSPGEPFNLSSAKLAVGRDEVYSESDLLHDTKRWRIGIPYWTRSLSAQGAVLAQSRTYFDGPDLVGLPLGQIDKGLVTRSQVWLAKTWLAEQGRWQEESEDSGLWIDAGRAAYNPHGQVTASLDATDVRSEIDYDGDTGLFAATTRAFANGVVLVSHAEYDAAYGNLLKSTEPNGETQSAKYDGLGRVREIVDPFGDVVSTFDYQEATATSPISIVTSGTLRKRDSNAYDMSYAYVDGYGRTRQVKEQADELGFVASGWVDLSVRGAAIRSYLPFGTATLGLEPAPRSTPVTRNEYDALGRLVRAVLPATNEASRASDLFTKYLPFEVHSFNERASNEAGAAYPVEVRFDGQGRAVQQTRYNLDERGKAQKLIWSQAYDALGRVVRFRDPAWHAGLPGAPELAPHERTYDYDSLGRLTHLYDANLGSLDYTYDHAGRPLTRTDDLKQLRGVHYDTAGRPSVQYFKKSAGGGIDYAYRLHYDKADPDGPLPEARGLLGRLAWVEHPTGALHVSYDPLGRPDHAATTLWDPRSSFGIQTRDTFERKVTYDPQGLPVNITLPGGLAVALEYDTRGLLRSVRGDFGAGARSLYDHAQYDALGTLVSVDQGNGTRTCNARDARGRRTASLTGPTASTDCSSLSSPQAFRHLGYQYTYDNLLYSISDRSRGAIGAARLDQRFGYDWLQQLTHVEASRGSYNFTYDLTQNLLSQRASEGVKGVSLGVFGYGEGTSGPNRVTSYCESVACQSSEAFAYDAVGRLVRYHGYELTYDVENRLVRAHKEGASQVEYYYDHAGERVLAVHKPKGKPARVIRTPFEGYQELTEIDENHTRPLGYETTWTVPGPEGETEIVRSNGVEVDLYLLDQLKQYVADGGAGQKPLAEEYLDLDGDADGFDAEDLAVAQGAYEREVRVGGKQEVWRWVHPDHLVTASHVSDSVGALVHQASFHPYGAEAERTGVSGVRGYAGGAREDDVDLGLQRFGARYYAPDLGRWITPDEWIGEAPGRMWVRAMESGLYGYVGNNPVNFRDPTGRAKPVVSLGVAEARDEAFEPEPNTIYRVKGMEFETDDQGRTIRAYCPKVKLSKSPRTSLETEVGKEGEKGDVGGHLIAQSFGGVSSRLNLVALNGKLNIMTYKRAENAVRAKAGTDEVDLEVTVTYPKGSDSRRPKSVRFRSEAEDEQLNANMENAPPKRQRSVRYQ